VEAQQGPAATEVRVEAQQGPAATEVRVEAQQGPAPAGGSRAVVVEIPDDDSPPPEWDQWMSFATPSSESQEGALVRRRDGHMVAGGRAHDAKASCSRAGRPAPREGRVDGPPAFADAQEEQGLWEELRDHGAALNRALNEALRIHGGPAWRVFQVRRRCLFPLISSSSRLFPAARRSPGLVCWRQELEHRARNKYGALDEMSAELRRLQEQGDAFVALAEALRTPDSWLSYRAEALRDQLQECEREALARPSTLERVCTALIERDEALQQARGDLERMRTLATNWEAEVAAVRSDNLELHLLLRGAQAQQS
jgi:signal transduction histidine kinase